MKGKKGIIYFDAHNQKEYGATGHVDLLGPQGPRTEMRGNLREIEEYLESHISSELEIYFWELKGNVPDTRGFMQKAWDWWQSGPPVAP